MRESNDLNTERHDTDTPMYMEALSGKILEEYFKAMDDEIQIIMRRNTWEIVSRKSAADNNMLPGTWYFKYKRKPDWAIRKFKARYFVGGDIQNILFPKPLN